MSRYTYRANLSAANVPTDPNQFGRSVIMKRLDQNYDPVLTAKEDVEDDIGVPIALYLENVLPSVYGFRSVGWQIDSPQIPGKPYFAFTVRSGADSAQLVVTTLGEVYRIDDPFTPNLFIASGKTGDVTFATVQGITYIYFAGLGCYTYNFTTDSLTYITLTGLDTTTILGITGTGGYLLAWSATALAWSSVTDPTDFVPSLTTGAGNGSVEGLQGAIAVCVASSQGVYVFSDTNVVSGLLSGNARWPFAFQEIPGALGVTLIQRITYEASQGFLYTVTTQGIQKINHKAALTVFPHLSPNRPTWDEIIAGTEGLLTYPAYGESAIVTKFSNVYDETKFKVVVTGDRFLCVSVTDTSWAGSPIAQPTFNQIHIFDMVFKRWGRFLIDHYEVYDSGGSDFRSIGIIPVDGKLEYSNTMSDTGGEFIGDALTQGKSRIILGRFQHVREAMIELHEVEIENLQFNVTVQGGSNAINHASVWVQGSLDGKTGAYTELYRNASESPYVPKFQGRVLGKTVSVAIEGSFDLNTVVLSYIPAAGRR